MASASERMVAGLTLHRSDAVAHTVDVMDRKARASARARGRLEGLMSKANCPFKPLGEPIMIERIIEMNSPSATRCSCLQHHDARPKRGRDADRADAERERDPDVEKQEEDTDDAQKAKQDLHDLPHGLFGVDLPRCRQAHRHEIDGFSVLQKFVHDSEVRIQQVKADLPGEAAGSDDNTSLISRFMPSREQYPPEAGQATSRGDKKAKNKFAFDTGGSDTSTPHNQKTGQGGRASSTPPAKNPKTPPKQVVRPPDSARQGHAPPREATVPPERTARSGLQLPAAGHKLPSLSEVASTDHKDVGELLRFPESAAGLDKGRPAQVATEDLSASGCARRGRADIRRNIEKKLDSAWKDKAFWKKITAPPLSAQELRNRYQGDEASLASVERYLRDLSAGPQSAQETNGAGAEQERNVAAAGGNADATGGVNGGAERAPADGAGMENVAAYSKGAAQMREQDSENSSVARLRSALLAYQSTRNQEREALEKTLQSKDVTRGGTQRRGTKGAKGATRGPDGEAVERMERLQKQLRWYYDLLLQLHEVSQDPPKVAHFILDFVRQVLEYGEEFQKDMFNAMLEQIDNTEFTKVVSSLIINMVRGIDGMTLQDLVAWFDQNRSEIPKYILEHERAESRSLRSSELPDVSFSARASLGGSVGKTPRTLTFVTE